MDNNVSVKLVLNENHPIRKWLQELTYERAYELFDEDANDTIEIPDFGPVGFEVEDWGDSRLGAWWALDIHDKNGNDYEVELQIHAEVKDEDKTTS